MIDPRATVLAQPLVQVRQRAKLFELRNQYDLLDMHGQPLGIVEQVNQSPVAALTRIFSDLDVMLRSELELRGPQGVELRMVKPWFRMATSVFDATGGEVGVIRKQIRMGKARFDLLTAAGEPCGAVHAQNWRAKDFTVLDTTGRQVGRVTKHWAGFAREVFTDADHYAIELDADLRDPLRSLALASSFAIDLVMKQKDA